MTPAVDWALTLGVDDDVGGRGRVKYHSSRGGKAAESVDDGGVMVKRTLA